MKPIIISFESQAIHLFNSMESTLSFALIIFLITLSIVSSRSQYVLPDRYFINCGSNSNINFTGKTFIGDENRAAAFSVLGGKIALNKNPTSNTSEIYRSARVFTKKSWYVLEADESNTFMMVHLYFSPFSYKGFKLSSSKFDVSVSGFSLLSNFNVEEKESFVIKEFIIPIPSHGKFIIKFTPSNGSSYAFVNAIEAFAAPNESFMQVAPSPHISPVGYIGDMGNISSSLSYAFSPIYRINVGGPSIDRDDLRRNWTPDDHFILNSELAKNVTHEGVFNHNEFWATRYDAPDDVYKTAKQLNTNSLVNNITWKFGVNKNTMYLVRAHFCDIISPIPSYSSFVFFIYSKNWQEINPGAKVNAPQIPFSYDFVVDSVESGFLNVSIGATPDSAQPVFLNGLEIMELLKNSGEVDNPKNFGIDIQNGGKSRKKVSIVVGCAVGGVLVLLIGFIIRFKYQKKKPMVGTKKESNTVPSDDWSSYESKNTDHPSHNLNMNLNLRFQFSDIMQATNSFDENLVIGKGGFGKVYKGTLLDGKTVAVKRGEIGHGQGQPEFVKEILVLSKIRHQHLVTLIGYCEEKSEMIIVYEYMEKGTLRDHLCNTNKDVDKLSWSQRLKICIGAAQGLHYLHTGLKPGIIHGDVKSTNILLTENYIAKVADFGISRWDNDEESEIGIKGSFGYLDPEYISCMKLTQKSDVYSFGVVLLEVLCARPALDSTLPFEEANLANWAIKQIEDGMVEKMIDPYVLDEINPNSLTKYVETVDKCLKKTGDERPSMIDVLWDLEYALKLQQMAVGKEAYEDSTMKTTLLLSMPMIDRLPTKFNIDDSQVNENSVSSYQSKSQGFP